MSNGSLRQLVRNWRNQADSFKHGGRRYEQNKAVAAARDCYGQMHAYQTCADELEKLLEAPVAPLGYLGLDEPLWSATGRKDE